MDNQEKENTPRMHRKPLGRMSYSNKGRYFKLRQVLNLVFMLLCIVGVVMYVWFDQSLGGIVLITAVVFKIFESLIRMTDSRPAKEEEESEE